MTNVTPKLTACAAIRERDQPLLQALLQRAGLPAIRSHYLRRTCAKLLLLKNINPIKKFTLDLYSHWIPEMEDFTADTTDEIFKPARCKLCRTSSLDPPRRFRIRERRL